MTTKPNTHAEMWRQLLDTVDIPELVAVDAAAALATLDRARTLAGDRERGHLQHLAKQRAMERDQPIMLHAQLTSGKKHALDVAGDEYVAQVAATTHADRCRGIAHQAANIAAAGVHNVARVHRDELIAWIARRRCTNVYACGYGDPITPAVAALWDALAVLLYPPPSELELRPDLARLPIVFDLRWSRAERSALAWCWLELHAGNVYWSQPPQPRHRRNPDTPADRLRFTRQPIDLPRVDDRAASTSRP